MTVNSLESTLMGSNSDTDNIGSPTDRSKRPRLEEESNEDYEKSNTVDRQSKRQAVPDPETKAPHFAGIAADESDEEAKKDFRNRRKRWEEYENGSQESDGDDEVQIVLTENVPGKPSPPTPTPHPEGEEPVQQPMLSIRSLVGTKDAGVIIGRGGKNVSEIREISTARVTISDIVPGAYERILTVSGPLAAIAKAYSLVGEKILLEQPATEEGQEQTLTIRILVPDSRMGTLIGRGGSVIKSIQEQSGARLIASEEPLPMSTERTITILGTPLGIQTAVYKICEILTDHLERMGSGMTHYKPQPQMAIGTSSNGSSGSGSGGGTSGVSGGSGSGSRGYSMQRPNTMGSHGYSAMMGMGGMGMNMANPQFYYQAGPIVGNNGYAHGSRGTEYGMSTMVTASQTQQILIPNEMVGCIIGKGGSKINEIRQMSGSHIKIADPHGDNSERLVTITGSPESNQVALYMLYARIESEKSRISMR
ncbi:hypothetical protein BDF14DRAFT_1879231 [Spinellus fusiger]|nr:hypothetical protein BDF14DRAFT_1879231 [Spinellus fusiger]